MLHTFVPARPVLGLASFVLALGACVTSQAGTGTLTAQVLVNTSCTVLTTALSFGVYDPILANASAPLNNGTTGTVSIACVKGTNATIALDNGTSGAGRRMRNASNPSVYLPYELYQPPNSQPGTACVFPASTVWNATNPLAPPAAPSKSSRSFNVCGTVPAAQDVEVGTYSDTVTVTVTF